MRDSCLQSYNPHRELSLDESTIGYGGRTNLTKRTPHKKVKSGIGAKVLADAHNGYVCYFIFDCEEPPEYGDLNKTARFVVYLAKFLTNSWHEIFMDNFYSSPQLFSYLLNEMHQYATGTWRCNFGVPEILQECVLAKTNPPSFYTCFRNDLSGMLTSKILIFLIFLILKYFRRRNFGQEEILHAELHKL